MRGTVCTPLIRHCFAMTPSPARGEGRASSLVRHAARWLESHRTRGRRVTDPVLVVPVTRRPVCGDFGHPASRTSRIWAGKPPSSARSPSKAGSPVVLPGGRVTRRRCGQPLAGRRKTPFARASRDAEPVETPRRRRRFPPASPATEPSTP
jgi:hypothetical protein